MRRRFAHQPNLDAVRWFLAEIWPPVRRKCPDLSFSIVGSHLPEGIARPEDGVIYLGPIDDLHAWFDTLRASVAPLRFGAGAKGKVASSLASGLPCVLSAIAAEGMNLVDGENVLIADTPEMFADRIVALTSDEDLWLRMSNAALATAPTAIFASGQSAGSASGVDQNGFRCRMSFRGQTPPGAGEVGQAVR
ncbi:glycosyltransferase family 4 protein [Gluconacetobacter sp. Hr-1-5]|uniref:glycosyltransferase family 4 protein n=1 Tax=Gluconacetobacter sp. Hr-1-5 TaxID=3395370 RepID=UPI003B522E31